MTIPAQAISCRIRVPIAHVDVGGGPHRVLLGEAVDHRGAADAPQDQDEQA